MKKVEKEILSGALFAWVIAGTTMRVLYQGQSSGFILNYHVQDLVYVFIYFTIVKLVNSRLTSKVFTKKQWIYIEIVTQVSLFLSVGVGFNYYGTAVLFMVASFFAYLGMISKYESERDNQGGQ